MTETDAAGNVLQTAAYGYDLYNRRIAKVVDPDGAGAAPAQEERFVYNNEHIALVFDGNGQQTHRYLHGPRIDQVLAEETPTGQVVWALADHQGTVRDWVDNDGTVVNHLSYDSFGNLTHQTHPTAFFRFGYTGREHDLETGYIYYRNRYTFKGRFISQDPLSFAAGDANLYRYVGNNPLNLVDPSGLASQKLTDLLSRHSRPRLDQPSVYIFNVKFPDYQSAFIKANNWFLDITEPPNPREDVKKPSGPIPWLVVTPLKGGSGKAVFRPIGIHSRKGENPFVPTIEFQADERGFFHMTPHHERAGRVKFEWNNKDDSCPVIPRPSFDRSNITVEAQPGRREPFSLPRISIPRLLRIPPISIPPIPPIPIPRIPQI